MCRTGVGTTPQSVAGDDGVVVEADGLVLMLDEATSGGEAVELSEVGFVVGSVDVMPIGAGCPGMPGAVGTNGCRIGVSVGMTVRPEQQVPSALSGRGGGGFGHGGGHFSGRHFFRGGPFFGDLGVWPYDDDFGYCYWNRYHRCVCPNG